MFTLTKILSSTIVSVSRPFNPYTHEPLPEKPYIESSQIYHKVTDTSMAFQKWRNYSLQDRISKVTHFVQSVIKDEDILKQTITDFTGKSYRNISQEYQRLGKQYMRLIENSRKSLAPIEFQSNRFNRRLRNKIIQEPVGLALIFPYFSEPIFDTMIHLIPCLLSGNGALLKVSDFNHFLGPYFENKIKEVIGIEHLVSDLFFHPNQLKQIRQFRPIKKLIYSGSQASARKIFEIIVETRFIDCNLFYGGQDCAYIDNSADLKHAAKEVCRHAFYNNGQSYDCIKRLYLQQEIADSFYALIEEEAHKINLGNPKDPNVDLGPLTVPENALRFQELINDAVNSDASCLTGGMVSTDGQTKGLFCEPTTLINCNSSMQVVQQQLHAPILCVERVKNLQEFENESSQNFYGTGVRIFTKEQQKYDEFIKRAEVGYISFNNGSILESDLPIEGWKKSGKGKMLSELSYEEYSIPKTYIIQL